jgi:hypothetical protein
MTHSAKLNEKSTLSDLATAIRHYNKVILEYQRSALRVSLDLGDALAWARARVAVRQWKTWRADHCPEISKRRDEVCRQLAASRPIIERALEDNPDLSIRDALRLIATPKARPKPKPAGLEKWRTLNADEKREGLVADGVDALLQYLPPEWRDELASSMRLHRIAGLALACASISKATPKTGSPSTSATKPSTPSTSSSTLGRSMRRASGGRR